jgi:hypothetical protein
VHERSLAGSTVDDDFDAILTNQRDSRADMVATINGAASSNWRNVA